MLKKYTYLIEFYFEKEEFTKRRAFFQTDEVFEECVVGYANAHSSIKVKEELYNYFMYNTQSQGQGYFIEDGNPIHVKVIQKIERGAETEFAEEKPKPKEEVKVSKEQLLTELCPSYKKRQKLKEILEDVDKNYHLARMSKLDVACIALLLRDNCFLFNQNIANKFTQFRKKLLAYYGLENVSYKENHCKERKDELRDQCPALWRDIRREE